MSGMENPPAFESSDDKERVSLFIMSWHIGVARYEYQLEMFMFLPPHIGGARICTFCCAGLNSSMINDRISLNLSAQGHGKGNFQFGFN